MELSTVGNSYQDRSGKVIFIQLSKINLIDMILEGGFNRRVFGKIIFQILNFQLADFPPCNIIIFVNIL